MSEEGREREKEGEREGKRDSSPPNLKMKDLTPHEAASVWAMGK